MKTLSKKFRALWAILLFMSILSSGAKAEDPAAQQQAVDPNQGQPQPAADASQAQAQLVDPNQPQAQGASPADVNANAGAPAEPPANTKVRTVAVLPATDTSNLGLGPSLQGAIGTLLQQTNVFTVQPVNYALPGFSESDVARAFQTVNTEMIAQVYLEGERVSIFMFDSARPKEFVVAAQTLMDPMLGNEITPQVVEYKLRMAFNDALAAYYKGEYQPLPGARQDQTLATKAPDDPRERAAESRRLFRELATIESSKYYVGADLGMARFSGGGEGSSSNVNFGAYGGMAVSQRIRLEAGFEFFSYALAHIDAKYEIALSERYLFIDLSIGLGHIFGTIFGPRSDTEPSLKNGTTAIGPGISFNVPLLGASVRGELKFYVGGGSIFMGTYGISYSI
jgi:hypothetical protein